MSAFAEDELTVAIFNVLNGHAPLKAIAGVWDHVKQGAPKPYVTIDTIASNDDGTKSSPGQTLIADINTWTEYKGKKEINVITKMIVDLIHEHPEAFICDNFDVTLARVDTVLTQQTLDTITYTSAVRARFICRAKTP